MYTRNNLSNVIFEEIIGFLIFLVERGGRPKKRCFYLFWANFVKKWESNPMFLLDVPKCKSIPEITCQNEVELYFFSFFPFWLSWRFLMAAKKNGRQKKWPPKKNGHQKYDQMMYLYVLIILMKLQFRLIIWIIQKLY